MLHTKRLGGIISSVFAAIAVSVVIIVSVYYGCTFSLNALTGRRDAHGFVVTDARYTDGVSQVQILTDDGELWSMDGCTLPLYAECEVEFDTNGTRSKYDDIISKVSIDFR